MTSSNGSIFRVTGHLCGEFTGKSPLNSPHKGQWHGALMFSLICFWINSWVNNCEAGDLRRYRAHYDATVMKFSHALTATFSVHIQNRVMINQIIQWPRQCGKLITQDIFSCIFFNENLWVWLQFSLKFVPISPIDQKLKLAQAII